MAAGRMTLQVFAFEGTHEVRTVLVDGDPWWVAGDVCAVLELHPGRALARLDEDEKGMRSTHTPGGQQMLNYVNEPGLYSLVLGSRKPQAKVFKRWITHEVIPALRRTGRYEVREPSKLELARDLVAALEAREAAEERARELEPAAQSWNTLAEASGDYSVREAAQILDRDPAISTGQRRLFASLRDLGWIDGTGQPYQRHVDNGRLVRRTTSYTHPHTGEPVLSSQVRVTVRGVEVLRGLLGGGQVELAG